MLAEFARNNTGLSGEHFRSTKIRQERGELTITDVHQAQVRHQTALAIKRESDSQVRVARQRLEEILQQSIEEAVFMRIDIPDEVWDAMAHPENIEKRPDIETLSLRLEKEKVRLRVAKSRYWPRLQFNAEQSRTWTDDSGTNPNPFDEARVGVDLNLDLIKGDSTLNEERERLVRIEQLENSLIFQRREATRFINESKESVGVSGNLSRTYGVAVEHAMEALKGIQEEFLVGTRTSLDALMPKTNSSFPRPAG